MIFVSPNTTQLVNKISFCWDIPVAEVIASITFREGFLRTNSCFFSPRLMVTKWRSSPCFAFKSLISCGFIFLILNVPFYVRGFELVLLRDYFIALFCIHPAIHESAIAYPISHNASLPIVGYFYVKFWNILEPLSWP